MLAFRDAVHVNAMLDDSSLSWSVAVLSHIILPPPIGLLGPNTEAFSDLRILHRTGTRLVTL